MRPLLHELVVTVSGGDLISADQLTIQTKPALTNAVMLMGLTGWMDGGDVSTGTIDYLVEKLDAQPFARIEPDDFFILNFPGSMEISALFRPHLKIEDGLVHAFDMPDNRFYFDATHNLVLFSGKEPNVRWTDYVRCVLAAASVANVERIFFVGSVGGLVPHTREPRMFSSVSHADMKAVLQPHGINFTNYEGPGSVISYMMTMVDERGPEMATLVAEIPPYVQGRNIRCIAAVIRKLSAVLEMPVDLDELRPQCDEMERRINELVKERKELADHIRRLEEDYDNEVFDTQMGDLKDWLQQQGVRVD